MLQQDEVPIAAETDFEAEIDAIKTISEAFARLDRDAQGRVLSWVSSRFGNQTIADVRLGARGSTASRTLASDDAGEARSTSASGPFNHPAELFESARPRTDAERALVLAYWFQVSQGATSFTSRQVNDELKHIGHGVGNITRALDGLIDCKPALVMQLEKSGKTKQAQKKFRLTHEGLKRVQLLLAGTEEGR